MALHSLLWQRCHHAYAPNLYPGNCWQTSMLLPCLGYWEQCCYQQRGARTHLFELVFSGYIAWHLAYTQEALNKYVGCEPSVRPNYTQRGVCVWGLLPPAHAGLGKSPTSVQILVSNKGPGRTLVVAFPARVTAHHGSDALTITGMHLSPHPPNSSGTRDSPERRVPPALGRT